MTTIEEIKEKRKELELLEAEYSKLTPPCGNSKCAFNKAGVTGQCEWSILINDRLIEDCKEYVPSK